MSILFPITTMLQQCTICSFVHVYQSQQESDNNHILVIIMIMMIENDAQIYCIYMC